jgi:hypothetical protein
MKTGSSDFRLSPPSSNGLPGGGAAFEKAGVDGRSGFLISGAQHGGRVNGAEHQPVALVRHRSFPLTRSLRVLFVTIFGPYNTPKELAADISQVGVQAYKDKEEKWLMYRR